MFNILATINRVYIFRSQMREFACICSPSYRKYAYCNSPPQKDTRGIGLT